MALGYRILIFVLCNSKLWVDVFFFFFNLNNQRGFSQKWLPVRKLLLGVLSRGNGWFRHDKEFMRDKVHPTPQMLSAVTQKSDNVTWVR